MEVDDSYKLFWENKYLGKNIYLDGSRELNLKIW